MNFLDNASTITFAGNKLVNFTTQDLSKATLIVDGEEKGEVETVGGVFYEYLLTKPTKEGATFAGW